MLQTAIVPVTDVQIKSLIYIVRGDLVTFHVADFCSNMEALSTMKWHISTNARMICTLMQMATSLLNTTESMDERFERVFDYMDSHEEPGQKVFFERPQAEREK